MLARCEAEAPQPLANLVILQAPDGGNYRIALPGNWRLRDGQLAPVSTPPVCLVSDLDDTMIGDDEGTAAFRQWWYEEGVPAGGRLVYNTGRALDLFEQLLQVRSEWWGMVLGWVDDAHQGCRAVYLSWPCCAAAPQPAGVACVLAA